ncbi:hypothetical protein M378DRAFT_9648, partial [Amanita muscaria Koide BX008]
ARHICGLWCNGAGQLRNRAVTRYTEERYNQQVLGLDDSPRSTGVWVLGDWVEV